MKKIIIGALILSSLTGCERWKMRDPQYQHMKEVAQLQDSLYWRQKWAGFIEEKEYMQERNERAPTLDTNGGITYNLWGSSPISDTLTKFEADNFSLKRKIDCLQIIYKLPLNWRKELDD